MASSDIGPLDWSHKFAGGIRADIRRRAKIYRSDWTDGLKGENIVKTSSSTLFLFFACLSPAIAFGLLFQEGTDNSFGVVEMIMSSAIAGIVWALFSGQPLCILGATGPVLAYTKVIYSLYGSMFGNEYFLPMYFWTGVWFSVFTVVMAASDMCCVVKHVTKFTEEIFAGLISAIFIVEAIIPTIRNFYDGDTAQDSAFTQAFFTFGTYMLATKLTGLKNTNLMSPLCRNVIGSFGVTIAILTFSGIAVIWSQPGCNTELEFHGGLRGGCIHVPFLNVPRQIEPTFKPDGVTARGWFVDPMPEGLPFWAIFFAIIPAAGFTVLGFLDQNLTTLLVNRKANKLEKPPAYHLDMLICGLIIYPICTVLCLPFPVAATVRSLTHLISLTNYDMKPIEGGGVRKVPVKAVEQRVTNLGIHVLIGLSLALAGLLKFVPKPVLLGVFLFMGVSSLNGNELFERLYLWAIWDSSKYPKYSYVKTVAANRIHVFTFLQLLMLGILYALKSIKAVAVIFPFFIAALVPIRWSFNKIFSVEELHALDGYDNEEEEIPNSIAKDVDKDMVVASGEAASADDAPVLLGSNTPRSAEAGKEEVLV